MSEFDNDNGNGHRALGKVMAQILPYLASLLLASVAATSVANSIFLARLDQKVLNLERNLEKLESHMEKLGGPY